MRRGSHQHIKNISEDSRHKGLALAAGRLALAHRSGIESRAEQLAQRAIAAIDLRNFEWPLRIVSHIPTVCRVKQEGDRRIRRAGIGMLLGKMDKLFSDAAQRIELERMFARAWLEKLIETLLEIDRRRSRHVIEVVALPIPGQRWPHRGAITTMKKVVPSRQVLLPGKRD